MILSWLRQKFREEYPDIQSEVAIPPDLKLGDYSSNLAFALAKREKSNPIEVGKKIIEKLQADPQVQLMFEKIEVVPPGFINFFLKPNYLRRQLANIHNQGPKFGRSTIGSGKTAIVEYSQPNIAKPMHVGHLRTTLIGDALANIYEFLSYRVIRWNYIGDWGTQFGKLIAAYKRWGSKGEIEHSPIETMLQLYVRFHEEAKDDLTLEAEGQQEFKKLEEGDTENKKLWEWFRSESLRGFQETYDLLGIQFTLTKGESAYEKELIPLIDFLKVQGIAKESQGALIVDLEQFKLPPVIIRKSDGASTYFTREVATLQHRLDEYEPAKMLYVVGNEQSLHFQQLFAVAQLLGLDTTELVHVKYGLVLGESGQKMATREGRIIPANDAIAKAMQLAREVVQQKNPSLSEKEKDEVSRTVAIGAIKYNDLMEYRTSEIIFDWKKMLDFSGNSGPYLQYTYARLASIRRKAGGAFFRRFLTPNLKLLEHERELRLMRHLLDFPDVVRRSAEQYATNNLALYLYELANHSNRYYEEVRILDDAQYRDARVFLIESVMSVLESGLRLLGIRTLDRM